MSVHNFISLGNILANQFKEEAEQQKESEKGAMAGMPNISDVTSMFSSLQSGGGFSAPTPSLPSVPSF